MITPCKMQLPEKDREEMSRRVQECCFADEVIWAVSKNKEIQYTNHEYWFIGQWESHNLSLSCSADETALFNRLDLPEIEPLDFLKKYEEQLEYFKLDLSDCDPTERKARWEIIKKAIPHHDRWEIADGPVAQYTKNGLCSHVYPIGSYKEKEITWEYFLDKYVNETEANPEYDRGDVRCYGAVGDAAEEQLEFHKILKSRNIAMLDRDLKYPITSGEQAYADSQVKPEPEQKRIIYIDDRPMSHRMGWIG